MTGTKDPRQIRGFEIAATAPVTKHGQAWHVASQSGKDPYVVTKDATDTLHCTCPDHTYRKVECKHIHAASFAQAGVRIRLGTMH